MKKRIIPACYETFLNEISLRHSSINFRKVCTLITHEKQEFYKNTDVCCYMFRDTGLSAVLVTKEISSKCNVE
jgi:hypothetical protein